jgi:uncharacterized protein YndB with AHSA1/START domain
MAAISGLAPGDSVIVLSRVFDAPRALVFEAFTKPEHLAQFWGPKGMRNAACTVDLRVGGEFRVDVQGPDGKIYPATGVYREIAPPERIVYAATTADDNPCGARPAAALDRHAALRVAGRQDKAHGACAIAITHRGRSGNRRRLQRRLDRQLRSAGGDVGAYPALILRSTREASASRRPRARG